MSYSSYFVTTAIPYVNSKPHIGHAQEFILADALARYYRGQGNSVVLQSGSDDNATKNVFAARAAGVSVSSFVDEHSEKFRSLLDVLDCRADLFVRTSSEKHFAVVADFLRRLNPDDVYSSSYTGLYCSGCEDFLSEKELVDGLCIDHRKAPEEISEENVFFRLSRYQERIIEWIECDRIRITPASKKKEILSFVRAGLRDISLSRASLRTQGWGIPYPGHDGQTVYVWIDALINYLSGDSSLWREDVYKVHVIGKNVWKFHAIYWPALLASAGLPLPNEIVIHGFLTNEGVKISKSLGNGIDPFELVDRYGVEAVRFYLLSVLSWQDDADFVEANLVASYNSELANKWGNLVSRVLALASGIEFEFGGDIELSGFGTLSKEAFSRIGKLNGEINDIKPWELKKNGDVEGLQIHLQPWIGELKKIALNLQPLLPSGSEKLLNYLKNPKTELGQLYPRR
jgi:Methionyl-tRNA synthetase